MLRNECSSECILMVVMHSFSDCEQGNVHVESFVACIVSKMAQDVCVELLPCHSHLVRWVFEGS